MRSGLGGDGEGGERRVEHAAPLDHDPALRVGSVEHQPAGTLGG
jgi:hypothetical protein